MFEWTVVERDRRGLLPVLEQGEGGLKGTLVRSIESQVTTGLKAGGPIEIYSQTRSITGSVQHLYSVGSYTAATLILLFSIVVPLTKSFLVSWAVFQSDPERRRRKLFFVEAIAIRQQSKIFIAPGHQQFDDMFRRRIHRFTPAVIARLYSFVSQGRRTDSA